MYNEKIKYYRKMNMMTQEELAEKLCVSRQTVTKWESGIILPNLEYIIDLSNIFGITIYSLIKDDDCMSEEYRKIDFDSFTSFIVKAKKSTYASKKNKLESLRNGSHDYYFEENGYKYYDSFFGSSTFSGQKIVYKDDKVCWSMNYYGKVQSDDFNGDFLKESLLQVDEKRPFRGAAIYKRGEYIYISHVEGDIASFKGHEEIYYHSQKIYKCLFHGGMIE